MITGDREFIKAGGGGGAKRYKGSQFKKIIIDFFWDTLYDPWFPDQLRGTTTCKKVV